MSDGAHLTSLNAKQGVVGDRVRAVAAGVQRGCYLWGVGGVGKTYTVKKVLEESGRPYVLTNTWVTGRGLFDLLSAHPEAVHVLDDVEAVLTDSKSLAMLRAATDSEPVRTVTYRTAREQASTRFTGGVIVVGNRPVGRAGPLAALATRLGPVQFTPTAAEVGAYLGVLAAGGFRHDRFSLSPDKCREVAAAVVRLAGEHGAPLNLRTYISGYEFRVMDEGKMTTTRWQDLLDTAVAGEVLSPTLPTRAVDKLAVARAIAHLPRPERVAAWEEKTGQKVANMYRYEKRLRAEGFDPEDN